MQDLPKDTHKALGEIIFWLDSINTTAGFRLDRRLELVEELDQAAKLHVRKLAQEYVPLRQQKFHENRVWTAQAQYWRLVGAGYVQCIEGYQADGPGAGAIKQRLPVIVGRALQALGQQLKWLLLRYGPIDDRIWGDLGRMYAFAEAKGFADAMIPLAEGALAGSSARNEFVKALMLASSSMESLLPQQIELAERSIALFASRYLLRNAPSAGCPYAYDLVMRRPPTRVQGAVAESASSLRYVGPGEAYAEIGRLLDVLLTEGVLPSDMSLGGDYDARAVADVWRHLLQYWSPTPPERSSARHPVNARLTIVHGFRSFTELLAEPSQDTVRMSISALQALESWVAENESDGGFGAVVPATGSDWLQVGVLVGIKVQGDSRWGAGVVRRMVRDGEQNRRIGIQRLARAVVSVQLSPSGILTAGNAVRHNDPGLLLTPKPDGEHQVQILMAPATFSEGQALTMQVRGQAFDIEPVRLLESTDAYDVAVFAIKRRRA